MKKYVDFLDRLKVLVIAFVLIVTLSFGYFLKDLAFEGSFRIWFGEGSQILTSYDKFRDTFGNDDAIMIAFEDKDGVFNQKAIDSIRRISDFLWQTKYVARVDSLINYQYIHADKENPDDIIVNDFIPKGLSEYELKEKREIAINDPLILEKLINQKGTVTMIAARLSPKAGENEDTSRYLEQTVSKMLEDESKITGYKYWQNGGPVMNSAFINIASHDGSIFMPLAIFSVGLLLWLFYRNLSALFAPMAVVVSTFIIVLSSQVILGYKLNNFTVNIPVFILAIAIAAAVHIYNVWLSKVKEGHTTKEAVFIALQKNFLAVFLTSITTSAGFVSLTISEIVPVSTLGLSTALGSILAFVLSVTLLPAVLLCIKKDFSNQLHKIEKSKKLYEKYGPFIVGNDKKIVFITLGLFVMIAFGIVYSKIDSNTVRYFHEDVEIRKSTQFLEKNLTGPMVYEIVADSKSEGGVKEPEFLKTVDRFNRELLAQFSDVRNSSSLLEVIKRFNEVFHNENKEFYTIPDSKELVAQYLLLYSLSLPQSLEINDRLDISERYLRISANTNIVDTSKDLQMIKWIESWWQNTPYSVKVEGQTAMFAYMQSSVTDTLIQSMVLAIFVISIVMIVIFKRVKLLGVFLLPNIIPIVLVLGVMGYMGIDIDMGVAVSGAIIIGVAVDDTIHYLVKFFEAQKSGKNVEQSLNYVIKYAGSAIVFTTVILSISFLFFLGSVFMPNVHFGIVTASALSLAMVADLLLLPAVLSMIYKRNV